MSLAIWAWVALGAAAGVTHSAALWRATHRWRNVPLITLWRWPAVVGILVGAAFAGRLLPAAGGWAVMLAGTSAWLCLRNGQ